MTPKKYSFLQILYTVLIIGFTLLPAANVLYIAASTGANNLSNDYLHTINLMDQILSGNYSWQNYFRDTLEANYHSFALLILIRLIIIKLTHWSIFAEIYVGFFFATIKVILLYFLIAPSSHINLRRWLWPVLSALVFSISQISMFTYGITAMQLGLIHIGIIGGILSLYRANRNWIGVVGMVLGGLVASWSGGGGLLSWPILLAGLFLFNYRRVLHYVIWACGFTLAAWPYIAYGVLGNPSRLMGLSLERIKFAITAIGYPFLNNIGFGGLAENNTGFLIGLGGLVFAGLGCALLLKTSKQTQIGALASILMIGWGMLSAIQTAASRRFLAPWYTTSFLTFWIGLIGLAFVYLVYKKPPFNVKEGSRKLIHKLQGTWAITLLVIVAVLYSTSNLTYRDKSFYLSSRSPASAACLRNYTTAPTYCEGLVFQWGIGNPTYLAKLAWPLEKHRLSVFAPTQQWTMQGDFILGRVHFSQSDKGANISWVDPITNAPAFWNDYHHLNLLLPSQNSVNWVVPIPHNTSKASLESAFRTISFTPRENEPINLDFQIYLETKSQEPQLIYSQTIQPRHTKWQNFTISLEEFAGESINLIFESNVMPLDQNGAVLLRYPAINLRLNSQPIQVNEPVVAPSNTSLSPNHQPLSPEDFIFNPSKPGSWIVDGVIPIQGSDAGWTISSEPVFILNQDLDLCLDDYSSFYLSIGVSEDINPRAAQIFYRLNDQTNFVDSQSFWIPLLASGSTHTYTYDLRLLSLPKGAHITGLRLDPVIKGSANGPNQVDFKQIGFLRANHSSHSACSS